MGPGNNGGDGKSTFLRSRLHLAYSMFFDTGLVAARHLSHFGYRPSIYYPKQPNKDIYQRLLQQCKNLNPTFVDTDQFDSHLQHETDLIVDAVFGFSFHGQVRDPYQNVISAFQHTQLPIVSVDIPSGWDVTTGPTKDVSFQPQVLVSLTAPKQCASHFEGKRHFLGGRFVPPALAAKFDFDIPDYPGADQAVEIWIHLAL